MSRARAAETSPNCGITIPSDVRCNKTSSDNPAMCQRNPVSNRCEFAKIPGKNKKYTLKEIQAIVSTQGLAPAPTPAGDPPQGHRMDNATLRVAVTEWRANRTVANARYGHISTWNTTDVSDMSGLFCNVFYVDNTFNDALDGWDTSNVTTMSGMFFSTRRFNQPLNNWDTRNVEDMSHMFASAVKFNQPLDKWDTSKVRTMHGMFSKAVGFSQKLDTWVTSRVQDMTRMFSHTKFNHKLDTWDTSNVRTMQGMFSSTTFNKPLGKWNTCNVTNMEWMFLSSQFNQPLGNWRTSQVTSMVGMFCKSHFNKPLHQWDMSHVQNVSHMFEHAPYFDQRLGDWKTGRVTSMAAMFAGSKFNQPIGAWDTGHVTEMCYMFYEARTFNQPLLNLKTGSVTDMSFMFQDATAFDQPLNHFDTSRVRYMRNMFTRAEAFNQPLGGWDTGRVAEMQFMFYAARAFNQPLGGWNTGSVVDMRYMFYDAVSFNQPLETWDISNVRGFTMMFDQASLMRQRYRSGQIQRHAPGALWGKVRAERRAVNKRLRFKWQELCDVNSIVSVDVLRGLALEANIPSAATLSKRELCAAFSRLWSSQADDAATALPGCTNERGLMQYPVADTPPEFFYRYTHEGTVYCDDIRHLYRHVQTSTQNPYTNRPYSPQIIDDIKATYRRVQTTARSMADFDDDEPHLVSFSSHLTRKLADLMSRLYYPNNPELFRGASEVHFAVFVQSLHDARVVTANERARVDGQSTLDERKALLVDLLILKIDQDPEQVPTSHGPVSRVAYEASEVYNNLFI